MLRSIYPAREQTPRTEYVGILQSAKSCLHTAHRQACHSTIALVGLGLEVGINIWDEVFDEHTLEDCPVKLVYASEHASIGQSVCADDDKRFALALGNHIVHDKVGASLMHPSRLVLSPSVL